jgi:hypothetical protein
MKTRYAIVNLANDELIQSYKGRVTYKSPGMAMGALKTGIGRSIHLNPNKDLNEYYKIIQFVETRHTFIIK